MASLPREGGQYEQQFPKLGSVPPGRFSGVPRRHRAAVAQEPEVFP